MTVCDRHDIKCISGKPRGGPAMHANYDLDVAITSYMTPRRCRPTSVVLLGEKYPRKEAMQWNPTPSSHERDPCRSHGRHS